MYLIYRTRFSNQPRRRHGLLSCLGRGDGEGSRTSCCDRYCVCLSDLREVLPLMASLCDKVGNMDHNRDRAWQCVMSLNEAFQ